MRKEYKSAYSNFMSLYFRIRRIFKKLHTDNFSRWRLRISFRRDGWNDLKNLICPCAENQTLPTTPNGYGSPLKLPDGVTNLDYWIVFSGNADPNFINTVTVPATNTIIIEKFNTVTKSWDSTCNHKTGGNIGRLNGSAEYASVIPSNKNSSGTTVEIKYENCAK